MITGNEPAMPIFNSEGYPTLETGIIHPELHCIGLTIRQQFAMAAMKGFCSNLPINDNDYMLQLQAWVEEYGVNVTVKQAIAKDSVFMADALIAELNLTEQGKSRIDKLYRHGSDDSSL